jgi:hypothetical protein
MPAGRHGGNDNHLPEGEKVNPVKFYLFSV